MTRKLHIAAAFALLALTVPARAAIVQWDLVNVTDGSGGTVTGFFDWNTAWSGGINTNLPAGSYSFTINEPALQNMSPFTATPANTSVFIAAPFDGFNVFSVSNAENPLEYFEIALPGTTPLDGSVNPLTPTFDLAGTALAGGGSLIPLSGEIEVANLSATPLPAALPLFGSALLALAGFAAYRSRREARG